MVMQIMDEVASRHDIAMLIQEKPFDGINGSGKHNNWSMSTIDDVPLLEPAKIIKATNNKESFPVIMAAVIAAVDTYGDLMRMSIASPGNDFRLGACEAPPAIVSTYIGDDLTKFLDAYRSGNTASYKPGTKSL